MSKVSTVSSITPEMLAEYIRIEEASADDISTLDTLLGVAKKFIQSYTGRQADELDNYSDFVIVVYILVQDMWDNRALYVDKSSINFVVESILDAHSVNLLPG